MSKTDKYDTVAVVDEEKLMFTIFALLRQPHMRFNIECTIDNTYKNFEISNECHCGNEKCTAGGIILLKLPIGSTKDN